MRVFIATSLVCVLISSSPLAAVPEAKPGKMPPHAQSTNRAGVIVKVSKDGREIVLQVHGGDRETLKLPASATVHKFTDFSEVKEGDRIHALLGGDGKEKSVRRAIINPENRPRRPPPLKEGKPRKDPRRLFGVIVSIDREARKIGIREKDGEIVTVPVAERVRINAVLSLDALEKGDRVVLLSRGPFDAGSVSRVIVQPARPIER